MNVLAIIVGLVFRFAFFSSLNSLLKKIREANRELSSGIIWAGFVPFLWIFAFPYIVGRLSVSLSFELASIKGKDVPEYPTRTAGICNYIFSLLGEVFIVIGMYSDEGLAAFGILFALIGFIFFVIYWVQILKYNRVLSELNRVEEANNLGINETEKSFHIALKKNLDTLKKSQKNDDLRNEILNSINSSITDQNEGRIFFKKYFAINNQSLINDIIDTRNYQTDIASDLDYLIQNGIVEMGYPHQLIS